MSEIKQKSLKKNFIMNAILTISGFIFPLITAPYILRVLKPGGTGAVRFATNTVAYFAMFAQLGIPTYGIKICANIRDNKEKLSKTVHELVLINLIMSVIVYVLFFASIFTISRFEKDRVLLIIISSTIFFNMIGIEFLYRALEQYSYITIRSLIFKAIAVAMMFLMVKDSSDYVIYGAITIFAASASNILNFIHSRKLITFRRYEKLDLKQHLKPIMVFFGMSCATQVYLNLDGIMLGFINGDVDVGYYDAAVKLKVVLVGIVTSLGQVLLPRASYYVKNKQMDEFRRIAAKALHFVWILATPMMVYFILFAKEGILCFSGNEYLPAVSAMQIIIPTILFIGISNILGIQILVPLGKEKMVLYSEIGGAVVDLVLNAILIPKYKAAGAAFGTMMAELVVVIIQLYFLRDIKDINVFKGLKNIGYWRIAAASLVAVVASFWVKMLDTSFLPGKEGIQNFIILVISAILFFVAYLVVMLITRDSLTTEIINGFWEKISRRNKAK